MSTVETASPPRDRWTTRAAEILKQTGVRDGYCVVLGVGSGRLIEELVRQSALRVIALEPDTAKVASARCGFFKQGVYGSRVHVVPGDLTTLKLAPYLASLVVSEEDHAVEPVMTLLRPYGGAACFSTVTRQGALPGAADWSHASGDAAHTFASQDQRIAAPLGVLWFAGGLDRTVLWIENDPPKLPSEAECSGFAGAGPPPRVAGGRMFIQIGDDLFASDIYTGRHLWKKTVKALDNFAATEDSVYAVAGRNCLRLDAATGKQQAEFRGDWREVRIRGDLLVGTTGKLLVCVDRHTGETRWKLESLRDEFGFAVGTDRVFCVDYWQLAHRQKDDPKTEEAEIIALKLASGEVLWRTQATTPTTALPKPKSFAPPLKPQLAFSEASDALVFTRNQATTAAYRGATGQLLWSKELLAKDAPTSFSSYHPPIVLADRLITHSGRVFGLLTGEPWGLRMWKGANVDFRGCGRALGSPRLITVRDGYASYFDLGTGAHTYFRGIRAGCTSSLIPADGVVVAPHYSRHCNCNYPLSFSSAFVTMPEAAAWDVANAEKSQ